MASEQKVDMYYIKRQGKIIGPLSVGKLKEMVNSAMITEETSVSTDKIEWLAAGDVDEIVSKKPIKKAITAVQPIEEEQKKPQMMIGIRQPDPLPAQTRYEEPLPDDGKTTPPQNTYQSYIQKPNQDYRESNVPIEVKKNNAGEINFFSILWDQVEVLPAIYKKYGDEKSLSIGLVFAAVTLACFYFGFRNMIPIGLTDTAADTKLGDILKGLGFASIPFLSLALSSMFVRNFFGDKRSGGFGGDVLIAGTAFLPIAFVFLLGTHIFGMKLNSLGGRETIMLAIGMGLYVETSTILLLFGGCTRISGIKENIMSIVIPVMLILSSTATYLIFKEFIKN